MEFKKQRGTFDLIDKQATQMSAIEDILKLVGKIYNYKEIRTPIFEDVKLYTKSIGETSDIVTKEFYNFKDKSDREIALRPEGTAGTIRAIVEEKLLLKSTIPTKVFYYGPMFRYERPQAGRQRQFNQFGIEAVGNISIYDEIETILFAKTILNYCGVKNWKLEINNLGSIKSRLEWINDLKKYFKKYKKDLTEDSIKRIDKNPLRILDDKVDGKKDFVINAPKLSTYLEIEEQDYFNIILNKLDILGIEYKVNETLVRGLDYYNDLIFEFISKSDKLKGQATLIGGGKYNDLVKLTGGPDVCGVGFALGIERLLIAINDETKDFSPDENVKYFIAPLDKKCFDVAMLVSEIIRSHAISTYFSNTTTKLDKHFKLAEKMRAENVLILGIDELKKDSIIIKSQKTKKEKLVKIKDLVSELKL